MMECCRSRPEKQLDTVNARVRLVVAEEGEIIDHLDEGAGDVDERSVSLDEQLHVCLSREEMTESARDHYDSINTTSESEPNEKSLTDSMLSEKNERYWKYEFKGT